MAQRKCDVLKCDNGSWVIRPDGTHLCEDHLAWERAPEEQPDEFEQILDELRAMHARKMQDYGSDEDQYQNVVNSKLYGVDPWIGACVRIGDKEKRLQEAAKGKALANETVEDSLIDNAVYNIIRLILWRRQHKS